MRDINMLNVCSSHLCIRWLRTLPKRVLEYCACPVEKAT
jgi:hypothetical protein